MKYGNLLWDLAQKGYYAKYLKLPESVQNVYRGMRVSYSYVKKLIKQDPHSSKTSVEGNFLYKPRHGCSSWSTSRSSARDFGFMILVADPYFGPNRFVINPATFDKTFTLSADEDETIGVGLVRVHTVNILCDYYVESFDVVSSVPLIGVDGPMVIASDDEGELIAL